jgi:hypothetical protein
MVGIANVELTQIGKLTCERNRIAPFAKCNRTATKGVLMLWHYVGLDKSATGSAYLRYFVEDHRLALAFAPGLLDIYKLTELAQRLKGMTQLLR